MLNSLFVPLSPENQRKIHDLVESIKSMSFDEDVSEETKILYIQLTEAQDVPVSRKQIKYILDNPQKTVSEIENKLIKEGGSLNPKIKELAINMGLGLGTIYYDPGLFGSVAANTLLSHILPIYLGPCAKPTQSLLNFASYYYFPQYTPYSLAKQFITKNAPYSYALGPLSVPLYQAGKHIINTAIMPSEETMQKADDFFDIMHGQADEQTTEKYEGSLATSLSPLNWLFNSSKQTVAPPEEVLEKAAPEENKEDPSKLTLKD